MWIVQSRGPGRETDLNALCAVMHDRGQDVFAVYIGQCLSNTGADSGNQRIGGTQVNAYRPFGLMWFRSLSRLGNLQ